MWDKNILETGSTAVIDVVENTDNVRFLADIAIPHSFRESSNTFSQKTA